MSDGMVIAVQVMQSEMNRMEAISQNMANASTPGYKRDVLATRSFADVMRIAGPQGKAAAVEVSMPHAERSVDTAAGALKSTGNPLDLAMNGRGYFEILTRSGPAYTRSGSFQIDAAGRLVNENGLPVSGAGGEIVLSGLDTVIDRSGNVRERGQAVAQIKMVDFPAGTLMARLPNGLLQPADKSAQPIPAPGGLRVGFLESSNVQPMKEMLSMMETMRRFESSQKLYQGYDEAMRTALEKFSQ